MRWALCFVLVVVGCNDSGVEAPSCMQIEQQIRDAIAMPGGSCTTDDDCQMIGGQSIPSCNSVPYVLECGGVAIEKNAPGLGEAQQLIRRYKTDGCATDCVFDCAPSGPVRCSADHRCTAAMRYCQLAADQ